MKLYYCIVIVLYLTCHAVELDVHVVTEAPTGGSVNVLLRNVEAACGTAHAQVANILHLTACLTVVTPAVILVVRTQAAMVLHL